MTHQLLSILSAALLTLTAIHAADAVELSLSEQGVVVAGPAFDHLTLAYPVMDGGQHKQSGVKIAGKSATVSYENGGELAVEVKPDGKIIITPVKVPDDVKSIGTSMEIAPKLVDGGTWQINDNPPAAFPKDKPPKPHMYQGQGASFTLCNHQGKGITITTPAAYAYNEVLDGREWNWRMFAWKTHIPVNRDWISYNYQVTDAGARSAQAPATEEKIAINLEPTQIKLTLGPARTMTLTYPALDTGGDKRIAPHDIAVSGATVTLKYANGATAQIVRDDQELRLKFEQLPGSVKSFRMEMPIDFGFVQGGQYAVGDAAAVAFPAVQPKSPMLYQGNNSRLTLTHPQGGAMVLKLPSYSYQQLQDNREWNWKQFSWFTSVPMPQGNHNPSFVISITTPAGQNTAAKPKIMVDQFGQNAQADYPGKIKTLDELKQDVQTEAEYYASLNPPSLDAYGGLPGSGEKLGLTKTGFFHCEKVKDRWVMVDPAGNAFFQLGVCSFVRAAYTYTEGRESIYEWIPPVGSEFDSARPTDNFWHKTSVSFHLVNMIRKYGGDMTQDRFNDIMIDRVRKFGFNSAGAFSSGKTPAYEAKSFPYVSGIPVSEWSARPIRKIPGIRETWDPFDEKNIANFEANCAESVSANKDDPLLIGYFLVNEPLYQDIPRVVPTLKADAACKRRLVRMLEDKYATIAAFNTAWHMQAKSFDELNGQGLPVTTQQAADDMQTYTGLFLETYFKLVRDTMKKYDPNHMLIGNRLQLGTANNQQLCEISGKYLDLFSLNYYTYLVERPYIDRLHNWIGDKPMMFTEFYWNSPSDSGLPGGVKDVDSQEERGLAYRHYVEHAAAIPYVVGVQWFTLVDASVTGQWFSKYTGENCNSGLINVLDRPWKTMIDQMVKTNYRIYDIYLGDTKPFVFNDPRFTESSKLEQVVVMPRVGEPLKIDGQSGDWPGIPATQITANRLVQGTPGELEASFKVAWDQTNLYVLVEVNDPTPMKNNYTGGNLWQGDAVELFIGHEKLDEAGPLLFTDRQILVSAVAGVAPYFVDQPKQPACQVAVERAAGGYTVEMAIPFSALGFTPNDGKELRFDVGIDDSADGARRDRQLMWNGINRNSGDRSAWGSARLTK